VTAAPTRVVGPLPRELSGRFFRNGPNPRTGWSAHLFGGGPPWRWGDEHPARLGVMPQGGRDADVRWFERVEGTSYLAVLDASAVEDGPVAEVHLPVRVPAGFHGLGLDTG
jgi:carotenoid cleavage dioxygenase-like enzyme